MSLQQIYLKTLELESIQRGRQQTDKAFIGYLAWLDKTTQKIGSLSELGMNSNEQASLYTRMANCVIGWVVDCDEEPSIDVIEHLAARKTLIWAIFQASAFGGQSILVERAAEYQFVTTDESVTLNQSDFSKHSLLRVLAVLSVNDANEAMVKAALSQSSSISFALWLGWAAERIRVTENALSAEASLLAFSENREPVRLSTPLMEPATCAYMYFTYMVHERKHEMKAYLNRCLAKTIYDAGLIVPDLPAEPLRRDKPKIIIPLERFVSGHAMHRCYAEYIAWLSEEFETVAIVNPKDIDEQSSAIFSRVILREKNWSFQDLVNIVSMEAPDGIYYPSIGMTTWVILLSNLRLAPVQFMTFGHPATSTSTEIDYVYQSASIHRANAQHYCTEKVCFGSVPELQQPWFGGIPNVKSENVPLADENNSCSDFSVVGVNAKIMKINGAFLDTLKRIDKEGSIHWNFFPAEKGIGFDGLINFLTRQLSVVEVHPYQAYQSFLESLVKCDMSMAPFPFGNSNSTADACLLNIPVVFLHGDRPESCGDELVLSRLQCLDGDPPRTISEYMSVAIEYLNKNKKYEAQRARLNKNATITAMRLGSLQGEIDARHFVQTVRYMLS